MKKCIIITNDIIRKQKVYSFNRQQMLLMKKHSIKLMKNDFYFVFLPLTHSIRNSTLVSISILYILWEQNEGNSLF